MSQTASYKKAIERLLSEIEGDKIFLSKHSDVLLKYATTGDYQGRHEMAKLVPEDDWVWPAYDAQIGDKYYKTKCGWFLRRLGIYAFTMTNADRVKQSKADGLAIQVKFSSGNPENTPQLCLEANGKIVSIDDPEYVNKAPCEKLSCSCTWIPKVDFTKPITPSGFISNVKSTNPNSDLTKSPKPSIFAILRTRLKYWIINKL